MSYGKAVADDWTTVKARGFPLVPKTESCFVETPVKKPWQAGVLRAMVWLPLTLPVMMFFLLPKGLGFLYVNDCSNLDTTCCC